uniref:Putative secreted protein n=1 Tax=Anopheles darlingi TaxID=43151 RepID=A0A2M4DPW9_ANODA
MASGAMASSCSGIMLFLSTCSLVSASSGESLPSLLLAAPLTIVARGARTSNVKSKAPVFIVFNRRTDILAFGEPSRVPATGWAVQGIRYDSRATE